jgi:hypothetical protein
MYLKILSYLKLCTNVSENIIVFKVVFFIKMGNLLYTDIDQLKLKMIKAPEATEEFKRTFWNYRWFPVETLKILRYATIYGNEAIIADGATLRVSKYIRGYMTVYSTVENSRYRRFHKLIMTYPKPNLDAFIDQLTLTVNKMSEDKLYAEVTITTVVPDKNKKNFTKYEKTAIFKKQKKQKSLFF